MRVDLTLHMGTPILQQILQATNKKLIQLRCIRAYKDIEYNEHISKGQLYDTYEERAKELVSKGFAEYENEPIDPNCKYSISVIIPVYNQEVLIKRTLDSIPTRNNIEIIVVDDKSTDNTYKALLDYGTAAQILFDYKLKEGKSSKTNAIYLLKMAKVID